MKLIRLISKNSVVAKSYKETKLKMILDLYMENHSRKRQNKWWFTLKGTDEVVARAVNGANIRTMMWYGRNKYQFKNKPKFVRKVDLHFKYPYTSKRKKTIGFSIFENDEPISEFYWDALRCREKGIHKNIGVNIFRLNQLGYLFFHIGLPKQKSSYFCLYENGGELVAVIARHHTSNAADNCKATLYIEKEENLLITLLACVSQIVDVINYWDKGENCDTSAGPLVSNMVEERELFDAEFLERVEKQGNQDVSICSLEITGADKKMAEERVDFGKEKKQSREVDKMIKRLWGVFVFVCTLVVILKLLGI